jgi:hypothetical protein
MPDRGDVQLHRLAERVEALLLDGDALAHAGVVDEHVHTSRPVEHLAHDPLAVGLPRQVGSDHERIRELPGELLEPLDAPRDQRDTGSCSGENASEADPEPRRRTCDDGDAAVETEEREGVEREGVGGRFHGRTLRVRAAACSDRVTNAAVGRIVAEMRKRNGTP